MLATSEITVSLFNFCGRCPFFFLSPCPKCLRTQIVRKTSISIVNLVPASSWYHSYQLSRSSVTIKRAEGPFRLSDTFGHSWDHHMAWSTGHVNNCHVGGRGSVDRVGCLVIGRWGFKSQLPRACVHCVLGQLTSPTMPVIPWSRKIVCRIWPGMYLDGRPLQGKSGNQPNTVTDCYAHVGSHTSLGQTVTTVAITSHQ